MKEEVRDITYEFFDLLGYDYDSINFQINESEITIKLQTKNSEILIGRNGNTIDSLERILRIIITNKLEKRLLVKLEINDYKKSKEASFENYIISKIKIVEKKGKDLQLPYYNAYKRKLIHSIVADYANPEIYSTSIGEGTDRRVHICKKDKKLTIDIDTIDI